MANLIITSSCNIRCPFCFAAVSGESRMPEMDMDMFQALVNRQAPGAEIRFCGGEPTQHPDFLDMLAWSIRETGRPVIIMTNGIWPDHVREGMAALSVEEWKRVSVLFNLLEETFYTPGDYQQLIRVLGTVYPLNTILGITIYSKTFGYRHLLDLAQQFNIPSLRYSIAAPSLAAPCSQSLGPEDYPALAARVHEFIMAADARGMAVSSDCGYIPFCMFNPSQQRDLLALGRKGLTIKFHCDSATDIVGNGEAWRCYGLSSVLRTNTGYFNTIEEMTQYFNNRVRLLKHVHLYEKCNSCEHLDAGICGGGCFVFRVAKKMQKDKDTDNDHLFNPFPLDDDAWLLDARPVRNPMVSLWENQSGEKISALPVLTSLGRTIIHFRDGENKVSFYEVFEACTGEHTVRDMIERWTHCFEHRNEATSFFLYTIRLFFDQNAIDFAP
ncbi:MAG: radical SAM protein [Desulfobacter sp.]